MVGLLLVDHHSLLFVLELHRQDAVLLSVVGRPADGLHAELKGLFSAVWVLPTSSLLRHLRERVIERGIV